MTQNYINHVALVLDASYSMTDHARDLIKVADEQIAHLARRSTELDQETRVSIYTFADDVRCEIFDKDVLRLPKIGGLYRVRGNTALIDATVRSQQDLAKTAQMYGDHAFLTFVLTDGEENASRLNRARDLQDQLRLQPAHWTVACLVPNAMGKHEAQTFGFAPDNIAVWDPNAVRGVEKAGDVIRTATENFMTGRAKGVRGTRSLFSTGADAVNDQTVKSTLTPITEGSYEVLPVSRDTNIQMFFATQRMPFRMGANYYQLTKTETIQPQKAVAIREKRTGRFYVGPQARDLLGLGGDTVRVKPDHNPLYDVFIQSTSPNRKLMANTDLLVLR